MVKVLRSEIHEPVALLNPRFKRRERKRRIFHEVLNLVSPIIRWKMFHDVVNPDT